MIEAQSLLLQLRVADYPNMKKEERRATHKKFHEMAYPRTYDGPQMTTAELNEKLKAVLNGK